MILLIRERNKKRNIQSRLLKALKKEGLKIKEVNFEDLEVFTEKGKISLLFAGVPLENFSLIFFRGAQTFKNLAFIICEFAKAKKIVFLNNFLNKPNQVSNKLIQNFLFGLNGLPIPKTFYCPIYSREKIEKAVRFLNFPIVLKKARSLKGKDVFLAKNKREVEETLKNYSIKDEVMMQEFIGNSSSCDNIEYRILVLGKKAVVAEKKTRSDPKEFRNNVALGATEEFLAVNQVEKDVVNIAEKAAKVLDVQIGGVDIVINKKKEIFLYEVNSNLPGFSFKDKSSNEIFEVAKYLRKMDGEKRKSTRKSLEEIII